VANTTGKSFVQGSSHKVERGDMPSKMARKDRKQFGAQPKSFTHREKAAMYHLSALLESLNIQDGYICADVQSSQVVNEFLRQVEECASILKLQMVPRSYREQFTANYRTILPSHQRQYLPDILMASMSQAPEGFVCVNGDMHPLSNQCRSLAAALRSSLLVLASDFTRFACNQCLPHLPREVRVGKLHLQGALRVFDEAWVSFEKEYVSALIQIEAKSRAPLVEAIFIEKLIGSPFTPQHTPELQRFLNCLSNLTAKVQLRHRRTDDALDCAVLMSASLSLQEHRNRVTSVSANSVTNSFMAARAYLQTIEARIEHVHPDLQLNTGLVDVLNALNRSCKLFDQWGQPGSANSALNSVVALAKQVMVTMPRFKDMCEECDPELFLVLPRILLLCCLRDLVAFQDILKKFLLNHVCEVEKLCKGEKQEQPHALPSRAGKLEALAENLSSTVHSLQDSIEHHTTCDEDLAFNLLIKRAVLAMSEDEQSLYDCLEPKSRDAASSTVNSFMLELEGWSLELQRHCPEAWNDFTALFLSCIGVGLSQTTGGDFQV